MQGPSYSTWQGATAAKLDNKMCTALDGGRDESPALSLYNSHIGITTREWHDFQR